MTLSLLQKHPVSIDEFKQQDHSWWLGKLPSDTTVLWDRPEISFHKTWDLTPRTILFNRHVTGNSFYYLHFLKENNPAVIADVGCGQNLFKPFFNQLIGYDPFTKEADNKLSFDELVSSAYTFDSVFSFCALHFIPATEFSKRIYDFAKLINPGGRGLITFNVHHLARNSAMQPLEIITHCDSEIRKLNLNLLVVHQEYYQLNDIFNYKIDQVAGDIDGNIRLIIQN